MGVQENSGLERHDGVLGKHTPCNLIRPLPWQPIPAPCQCNATVPKTSPDLLKHRAVLRTAHRVPGTIEPRTQHLLNLCTEYPRHQVWPTGGGDLRRTELRRRQGHRVTALFERLTLERFTGAEITSSS